MQPQIDLAALIMRLEEAGMPGAARAAKFLDSETGSRLKVFSTISTIASFSFGKIDGPGPLAELASSVEQFRGLPLSKRRFLDEEIGNAADAFMKVASNKPEFFEPATT